MMDSVLPAKAGAIHSERLALLKFSTQDCPACQFMHGFDARVAAELGLTFIDVDMKHPPSYTPYRRILLHQHPNKRKMALPAYLLVQDPEGNFQVLAELIGAMQEEQFRSRLCTSLPSGLMTTVKATPPDNCEE